MHSALTESFLGDWRTDKNIHAGGPNEKKGKRKTQHISPVVTEACCFSLGISLLSYERELMRTGKPSFTSEKYSCIIEKGWLSADTHMHRHTHRVPSSVAYKSRHLPLHLKMTKQCQLAF